MELDKTIRENLNGKYLIIHANQFQEGVTFASRIGISQIQLRGVLGHENSDTNVDFKGLEKLSDCLKVISFADSIENIINIESIYSLKNIEKIYFQQKQNFVIDISRFPKIVHLGSEYWKGLSNIEKAISLDSLVIIKYPENDLSRISRLTNLETLHIYSSKVETLKGLENLSKLRELSLVRNNRLEDIGQISIIKSLKELHIEKCKKIEDCSFIANLDNIEHLYLDKWIK